MRILITGSRSWEDYELIRNTLATLRFRSKDVVMVSGACPRGADAICEEVAAELDWKVERHPADWERWGKRAGYIRNSEMVELGADLCLAFIRDDSAGATMTYELAKQADIDAYRINHPEEY